jgi:hypothetical protein
MKRTTPLFPRTLLAALLIATAACAENPMTEQKQAPPPRPEPASLTLWRQIQAEVGDAACDGPQQCHSIAIGAKACGGPDSYLAWSSKSSDAKKLRGLVEQHAAARKAENLASDMRSDCRLVSDPGARCVPKAGGAAGQVCVLNERGSGGGGGSAL